MGGRAPRNPHDYRLQFAAMLMFVTSLALSW
jgi:hypothetical protein